jgi:hypothetical protein
MHTVTAVTQESSVPLHGLLVHQLSKLLLLLLPLLECLQVCLGQLRHLPCTPPRALLLLLRLLSVLYLCLALILGHTGT